MEKIIKNSKIFITATNTDVGKSYISEQLIYYYSLFGFKVGVLKPIETGVIDGKPLDGMRLFESVKKHNGKFHKFSIDDIVPYQFELPASPYVAKGKTDIDIEKIKDKIEELSEFCDILLVEGAGGLMAPIELNYFMIDLIESLKMKTLLVAPSNLGSINDTLLSIEKIKSRNLDFEWIINLHRDKKEFPVITEPFYRDYFGDFKIFQKNSVEIANSLIYK
jgi:dethiobiotin synthetase